MKNLRTLAVAPVLAMSLVGFGMNVGNASAAGGVVANDGCVIKAIGQKNTAGNSDRRWTLNGDNTATVTFTVTGEHCSDDVTLASWQAPDADKGRPYSAQTLFKYTTDTFGAGTHGLTISLPNCFYQLDLVPGSNPTDANGGPQYFPVDGRRILASLHGGTVACEEGGKGGGGVTPTPTTPEKKPVAAVEALPDTGNSSAAILSSVIATVAVSAVAFRLRLVRQNV